MNHQPALKTSLKRGALIAAANWQVVVVQFVAESVFKILLAVPLVGGALLGAVLVGGDIVELVSGDVRNTLSAIAGSLAAQPVALVMFVVAFLLAVVGGSALVFLVKGGTVSVLVAGDRAAGPIEQGPLRLEALRRASAFSIDSFTDCSARLFRRYLVLGLGLIIVYALSGGAYLIAVFSIYRKLSEGWLALGWTTAAALCSIALVVWITIINLLYLLVQAVIAVEDCGVRASLVRVGHFLRVEGREVAAVFAVVFVLVVLATVVSLIATVGLGLIAFVPLAGIVALPLQAAAWLLRGLVFQYLGLTALGAYLTQYRAFREAIVGDTARGMAGVAAGSP